MRSSVTGLAPTGHETLHHNHTPSVFDQATASVGSAPVSVRSMQQIGTGWLTFFAGGMTILPDLTGIRYLVHLLESPERGMPAEELRAAESGQEKHIYLGSSGEIADREYIHDLQRRLTELNEELSDAEERSDWKNQERLEIEKDRLMTVMSEAVGRNNRLRTVGSRGNTRSSVSMAVIRAKGLVNDLMPMLGRYLQATIFTGSILIFRPMAGEEWDIRR